MEVCSCRLAAPQAPLVPGTDVSSPFVMMNRNKRGVALNLREEAGRQALGNLTAARTQTRRWGWR